MKELLRIKPVDLDIAVNDLKMTLKALGYNKTIEDCRKDQQLEAFGIGRIIAEHKERYIVKTAEREFEGEVIGNLRFTATSRADFPAVGDWVAISEYDEDKVLIHKIFPRKTIIERKSSGKQGDKQIIATNVDVAFIIQAVDRDFNINRIERYLSIVNTSKIAPVILLNKTDLISDEETNALLEAVKQRINEVSVIAISNASGNGIEDVKRMMEFGKTYCLLGSSGVGKSSLLNTLMGEQLMKTGTISSSTNRGKHITTHRELRVMDNGGILIDNPGMREIGLTDASDGLESTFDTIMELAKHCKFKDCTHTSEMGCAVIAAVERSEIDASSYENFLKMEREKEHYEASIAEKRKKDKSFGKMVKNVMKHKHKY